MRSTFPVRLVESCLVPLPPSSRRLNLSLHDVGQRQMSKPSRFYANNLSAPLHSDTIPLNLLELADRQ